ncbi:MAG TPA: phytanoyl-CoA dioxygenase family protein [Mycobacteriales bacterium]|nr:phytanoyl-CoA dioxygenase family protein [Mycobacteriales bacterium]
MKEIAQADIDHWHRHGYVIVERFLDSDELVAVQENLEHYMPPWEEYAAHRQRYANLSGGSTRGAPGWVRNEFPYVGDALNRVALHPFLIGFAERLVGHGNLAMSHGAVVGKYAGKADYDQDLHPDYTNNTLAFPASGVASLDIPMIVYHTEVTVDLGPTYVVSDELTRHLVGDGRRFHPRDEFPELYEAERPATAPAGSVLIYNMRTFHRGSAMHAAEGVRFSQFVAYHTAGPGWLGSTSFQGAGDTSEMNHLLTQASPRERQLLGFPAVGDPYWDEETLAGVAARYPEMDMTPYKEAS